MAMTPLSSSSSFRASPPHTLHQGDCVTLDSDETIYQVIGIDDSRDSCWVRRWPLERHGSPVFEISLQQVESNDQEALLERIKNA